MAKTAVGVSETLGGLPTVSLDEFVDFQGTLKTLTDESYSRLRESLLKHGVSFPVFVWQHETTRGVKNYVIDGHQRLTVLRGLREEGYIVPTEVPVVLISAANRKEAKEKLLLAVSQYGHLSPPGFEMYIEDAKLNLSVLKDLIQLPDVDLSHLQEEVNVDHLFEDTPIEVPKTGKTATCPKCGEVFEL